MNKSIVLSLFFSLILGSVLAQINITTAYSKVGTDFEFNPDFDGFSKAATAGIGYRIPMKQKRIEFYPQVSLTQSAEKSYTNKEDNAETIGQTIRLIGGKLDTRFYIFDFGGDCNCPAWGNE